MKISRQNIITYKRTISWNLFYDNLLLNLFQIMIFVMPAKIFNKMKLSENIQKIVIAANTFQ